METGLKQKLEGEVRQALKSGDKLRVSVLRLVLSAVNYAESTRLSALPNGDILGIIAKEVKQRDESILAFKQGNRPDLAAQEEAEKAILQEYLPQQMTRDEIIAEVRRVIAEVGAQGPRDKGKVMPKLVAALKGKADGREINEVVTELLGSTTLATGGS
ncbi:MAG: GatB/YqeY domain-containing protein [Chloroflexi bacterium]|nr:GatB/YqeY domain-containing protein [Chloroflexota bacterium]